MTAKKGTKKDLAALLEEEGRAAEANPDAPITEATTVTRGHGRTKTLQIRLNPEELEELERVAASRGLPTSTVAREAILRLIRPAELRSADARRLVADFARYVDSLAVPAAGSLQHFVGGYTINPVINPRGLLTGMAMGPTPGSTVTEEFPKQADEGKVSAASLFEVANAFYRYAQELENRLGGPEQSDKANAPTA